MVSRMRSLSSFSVSRARIRLGDPYLIAVVIITSLVSVAAYLHYLSQDSTLLYIDSYARLLITRRVIDSPTPGMAQLGSVWPPLTHVLALPLIGVDSLYRSGFALAVFSMLAYVLTAVYMYKILVLLTGERVLGVIAAFALVGNANMMYMQSTSMTELPSCLAMIAAVYYLLKIGHEPENPRWLILNGLANTLGCLIRYEVWILVMIQVVCIAYIYLVKKHSWGAIEGRFVYWSYWTFAGIVFWIAWNWLIFGDPLSFQQGEYAKPSLWVTERDAVIGDLRLSFLTYFTGVVRTAGPLLFVGLLGAAYYLQRTRLEAKSIGAYAILGIFPAFVLMLYTGQRPMQIVGITSESYYNVRFALIMLIPLIIFVVYTARGSWIKKLLITAILMGSQALMLRDYGIVTLREPQVATTNPFHQISLETAAWLNKHYDGRPMLMEGFSNEVVQFASGIELKNVIYEGSYRIWEQALAAPHEYVDWVYMRERPDIPDKVWQRWRNDPQLDRHFEVVYANDYLRIYRRIGLPPVQEAITSAVNPGCCS